MSQAVVESARARSNGVGVVRGRGEGLRLHETITRPVTEKLPSGLVVLHPLGHFAAIRPHGHGTGKVPGFMHLGHHLVRQLTEQAVDVVYGPRAHAKRHLCSTGNRMVTSISITYGRLIGIYPNHS